jgi:hypothetical protein
MSETKSILSAAMAILFDEKLRKDAITPALSNQGAAPRQSQGTVAHKPPGC